jgi:hypothetical protein
MGVSTAQLYYTKEEESDLLMKTPPNQGIDRQVGKNLQSIFFHSFFSTPTQYSRVARHP